MIYFPIHKFVQVKYQKYVALTISIIGFLTYSIYPNQVSIICEYFICWWLGVEIANAWMKREKISLKSFWFIHFAALIMLVFFNSPIGFIC